MVFNQPLNLEYWILNSFAGSAEVFAFLAVIIISSLSAKYKMPNIIFLMMILLFAVLFSFYLEGIYLILILVSGLSIFYIIANYLK